MPAEKTSPSPANKARKKVEITDRQRRVAELVLSRIPQYKIAEMEGVDPSTISLDVKALKEVWREEAKEDIAIFMGQELAALDRDEMHLRKIFDDATSVGSKAQVYDRIMKIIERRAKMLGIDAPKKIAPTDPSGQRAYASFTDEERLSRLRAFLEMADSQREQDGDD